MAYSIKIAGIDKTSLLIAGSLTITRRAGNRNDCLFSITTTAATYLPDVGQDVQVFDGTEIKFGGVIKTITHKKLDVGYGNTKKIELEITSDGYNSIPSRRTITGVYDQKSAGYIVSTLATSTLSSEGITIGTIETGANPVGENGEYDAICKSCAEVYNDMATASGCRWYINDSKELYFVSDNVESAAAHDIVEGGEFEDFLIDYYEITLDGYANKVFVRGGVGDDGNIIQTYRQDEAEQSARQTAEGGEGVSTGVYGTVINDSNIELIEDAKTVATNTLKKSGIVPRSLLIKSWTLDWEAGTKLKVNLPTFGISSDTYYLIEEVIFQDNDGMNLYCTIKASIRKSDDFSTQESQSGIEYFGRLVSKAKSGGKGLISDGSGGLYSADLYVQNEVPVGAKERSVWIDTDDYSQYDYLTVTGNTTVTADGAEVIICDSSSPFTVTLFAPSTSPLGKVTVVTIKNVGSGTVTVDVVSSGTIDGASSKTLSQWDCMRFGTRYTEWMVL